jgi:hypothetical protein
MWNKCGKDHTEMGGRCIEQFMKAESEEMEEEGK